MRRVEATLLARLKRADYPHGLRFTPDGAQIVVADAGRPHLLVFDRDDAGWRDMARPTRTVQVMDHGTYLRGRNNPQEGGNKGLDPDPRRGVLVVTSEHQPLSFFRLDQVLGRRGPDPASAAKQRATDQA